MFNLLFFVVCETKKETIILLFLSYPETFTKTILTEGIAMKTRSRLFCIITCITAMAIFVCGCSIQRTVEEFTGTLTNIVSKACFGFSKSNESETEWKSFDEIKDYKPVYEKYYNNILISGLNEGETAFYRALQYAFENSYPLVYMDNKCIEKTGELDYMYYIVMLSVSSPLIIQNISYKQSEFSAERSDTGINILNNTDVTGVSLEFTEFKKEHLEKKLLALKKSEEIVSSIPDNYNKLQRAEYLYRYLADRLTYKVDENNSVQPDCAYNALYLGTSHCDGFSNALSMLYHTAGINCFEKVYFPEDEAEVGHTWNCFEIDGKWYNADLTMDSKSEKLCLKRSNFYVGFAFPDSVTQFAADAKYLKTGSVLLKCTDTSHYANEVGISKSGNGLNAVVEEYKKNGRQYAVIIVDSISEGDIQEFVTKLCNKLQTDINYEYYKGKEKSILYIYK